MRALYKQREEMIFFLENLSFKVLHTTHLSFSCDASNHMNIIEFSATFFSYSCRTLDKVKKYISDNSSLTSD